MWAPSVLGIYFDHVDLGLGVVERHAEQVFVGDDDDLGGWAVLVSHWKQNQFKLAAYNWSH